MICTRALIALIPRGGEGLIRAVVEESTVPVTRRGRKRCAHKIRSHFVDAAVRIIINEDSKGWGL